MFRTRAAAVECLLTVAVLAAVTAPAVAARPAQVTAPAVARPARAVPAVSDVEAAGRSLPAWKPPLGMLEAIRRDLGLTAGQAQSRLLNESRLSPIAAQLRGRLGDLFAGSWLQGSMGQTLVVATTSRAGAAQIADAGARPLIVPRSLAELRAVKEKLTAVRPALSEVSGVRYVNVRANKVVILSSTPRATAGSIKAAGVAPAAVRVIASAERPRLLLAGSQAGRPADLRTGAPGAPPVDLVGGQTYYAGATTRCSVGFSVTRGDLKGFVGAGRCGAPGTATVGFNRLPQGTVQASTFPGGDHSWVALDDTWTPRPLVGNDSGGTMYVYGSREAIEGSSVCLAGSSAAGLDWHCGVIAQRDADVTYPEGVVTHMMRTSACGTPGNAGASMLSIGQAQGIVSGGSGNCATGGVTYVQPINDILAAYGLTLMTYTTRVQASTGSCNGYPNSVTGALRNGQSIYQPGGLYYRTTVAGDHYGCLEADPSGDFDLYLQKQDGLTWTTVAVAETPSPFEELDYRGPPGFYRYLLLSYKGAGPYTLGYTTP